MNWILKYKHLRFIIISITIIVTISAISYRLMKDHIDYWKMGISSFPGNHSNLTVTTLPAFRVLIKIDENNEQLIYENDGLKIFSTIIPDENYILLKLKSIDTALNYNIGRTINTNNYADYLVNREHNIYGCFYTSGPSYKLGNVLGFRILEKPTIDAIEIEIRNLLIYTYERH